jgi:hypothetical protein
MKGNEAVRQIDIRIGAGFFRGVLHAQILSRERIHMPTPQSRPMSELRTSRKPQLILLLWRVVC